MQQANRQQYFDEFFFFGRHNRPRETFWDSGDFPSLTMGIRGGQSPNVSTTPITAMGCWQCLLLSGKHCCNGVIDMFGKSNLLFRLVAAWFKNLFHRAWETLIWRVFCCCKIGRRGAKLKRKSTFAFLEKKLEWMVGWPDWSKRDFLSLVIISANTLKK